MGRCCSLFTRSTCRNPWQIAPTATGLPYTYSTPYPMLKFIYNIFYCHHRHVSLFLLPCNSNPMSTVYTHSTGLVCIMYIPPDVCIYIMYTYQMHAVYNTCCFPSPSDTQHSPHPALPISTRPTSSRWVPSCAVVLLKVPS